MKILTTILVVAAVPLAAYVISTGRGQSPSFTDLLASCGSLANGSTETVRDTTRLFINLPKSTFPDKDHALSFSTATGTTKALWISNAGPYGEAFQTTANCWSYYYEFDGPGEIDLTASGTEPYSVRFIVTPA